jgi:hypothetical protein
MAGSLGILNVGAGDTKLTFDKANKAETIRASRIVTDMLKRGYALLIEVSDGKGGKAYQRVKAFREDTAEYVIADFDPTQQDQGETSAEDRQGEAAPEAAAPAAESPAPKRRGRPPTRTVKASETRGVAVARSSGG